MLRRHITCSAVVGALTCVALLTACSKGTPAGGTATVPTAAPTTADPWAVPATITPEYLNKVLAKLNQIDGDAIRDARRANEITPTFNKLEHAIRASDHEFGLYKGLWESSVADGWKGIALSPGDRKTTVISLEQQSRTCLVASAHQDLSAQAQGVVRTFNSWYVALVPVDAGEVNPTHWGFQYDGHEADDSRPKSPCDIAS